jgi:hypothetical protein
LNHLEHVRSIILDYGNYASDMEEDRYRAVQLLASMQKERKLHLRSLTMRISEEAWARGDPWGRRHPSHYEDVRNVPGFKDLAGMRGLSRLQIVDVPKIEELLRETMLQPRPKSKKLKVKAAATRSSERIKKAKLK